MILDELLNALSKRYGIELFFGDDIITKVCQDLRNSGGFFVVTSDTLSFLPTGMKDALVLPSYSEASDFVAQHVINEFRVFGGKFIVGLGGGTVCDLCKHCSWITGKKFIMFPTCPSVNAFCSCTSSLINKNGKKQSIKTVPPNKVICDISILVNSPIRLICSGFGDLISAEAARADYLLSHLLLGTDYKSKIWDRIYFLRQQLYSKAQKIPKRDPEAVTLLMKLLLVQGFMMLEAGNSKPLSQAEHQIAHCIEEKFSRERSKRWFHGEIVSVASITALKIQESIYSNGMSDRQIDISMNYIRESNLDLEIVKQKIYQRQNLDLTNINKTVKSALNSRIDWKTMYTAIKSTPLPTHPSHLDLKEHVYENFCKKAPLARERFGFLDLYFRYRLDQR